MGRTAEALVVDASVAVKWHLEGEDDNEQATLLLTRFSQGSILLVAPEQIRFEVPSAITAATLGKQPRLSQEEGKAAIDEFLALGLKTVGSDAVILAAYPLVQQYGCSFYDALYVALALDLALPLITADRKLYERIKELPDIIWLGYQPAEQN
jgi:predicted nucleic acid-binding protein